jgi:hypothetical protein
MAINLWTKLGESLSHKNACKEYGLNELELITAIRDGKLQCKINYAHGNPYYKLLRSEVRCHAVEHYGLRYVERQELEFKIRAIRRDINSCRRKLKALEKENLALTEELARLERDGPNAPA